MMDLIAQGSSWDEVVLLAKSIEEAGATLMNTGIGWHEARIPTIAAWVPEAGFAEVTRRLKSEITIPVITSNRINTPECANALLEAGMADLISMARPCLADAAFAAKAKQGDSRAINVCIACNQACLDQVFVHKTASCLVNPRACHETQWVYDTVTRSKQLAVVGAGPAGLAFAAVAASRGHQVTLFERTACVGGQFNFAKQIPGKEVFQQTLNYFMHQLDLFSVDLRLKTEPTVEQLQDFDEVVVATGVLPRMPLIEGIDHPSVMTYAEVFQGTRTPGARVAVIGAGGIGFDMAA